MVMPMMGGQGASGMMSGPAMAPEQDSGIDDILVSKVVSLPLELKQSLLKIITDMENPSAKMPVSQGLESNLMGSGM